VHQHLLYRPFILRIAVIVPVGRNVVKKLPCFIGLPQECIYYITFGNQVDVLKKIRAAFSCCWLLHRKKCFQNVSTKMK